MISMMKKSAMVNMKEAEAPVNATAMGPEYPYGLRISLDKDDMEKLGIKELPEMYTCYMIMAAGCVVSVEDSAGQDGERKQCTLQIMNMMLHAEPSEGKPGEPMGKAEKLYNGKQ